MSGKVITWKIGRMGVASDDYVRVRIEDHPERSVVIFATKKSRVLDGVGAGQCGVELHQKRVKRNIANTLINLNGISYIIDLTNAKVVRVGKGVWCYEEVG